MVARKRAEKHKKAPLWTRYTGFRVVYTAGWNAIPERFFRGVQPVSGKAHASHSREGSREAPA